MTTQSEAGVPTRSTWQLDPAHTLVEFSGKHMMFTAVKGYFKSTRVERQALDYAKVIWDLTIRGITREVVLDTELAGRGKDPRGS